MIDLGLTHDEQRAFHQQLLVSHQVRVRIQILDRNEAVLHDVEAPQITAGEVHVDTTGAVSRSLSLTALDPHHRLKFDGASPAKGAIFADNFIQVWRGVWVPSIDRWVDVPVFRGPVTAFERNGPEVTLEAQGKESLALDPHFVFHGYTLNKGYTVRDAIRNVMGRLGEATFAINMVGGRLNNHRTVTPGEEPWAVLIGGSTDANGNPIPGLMTKASNHLQLYYDGRGRLTAKPKNNTSKWTFDGTQLTDHPGFTYDVLRVRNHVEVEGGTPKGSKSHFRGSATLANGHPMSPATLARNGKGRYMVEFFQSDALKSDAACAARAQSILTGLASQGIQATFECLPIPHLEEHDTVKLAVDGYVLEFNLSAFSIPLTAEATMSVGFLKNDTNRIRFTHNYTKTIKARRLK